MNGLFECIPNVSEGRDAAVLDACAAAIIASGAQLAHRTSDPVHHRSVFTYFGDAEIVVAAAVALARVATTRIDLRKHRGVHPRMGALDVVPFVPLEGATLMDAATVATLAASAIWNATGVPSFLYDAAARKPERRLLADVRRGGFEGVSARIAGGDLPDIGDQASESAGAIAVGAREVLIAFNIVLRSADIAVAERIARALRESSGGLRTLRAIGLRLDDARVQISCNVTAWQAVPLHRLFALVRIAATRCGVVTEGCELIGLAPRAALKQSADHLLGLV